MKHPPRTARRPIRLPAETVFSIESEDKDSYIIWFNDEGQQSLAAILDFQSGPIPASGVNGITNEVLIEVLIDRIGRLNNLLPCMENANAIACMQQALGWLNFRTSRRLAEGVEGTEAPHGEPGTLPTGEPS